MADPKQKLIVVHIARAPFGGIRQHVMSLMEQSSGDEFSQWLVTSAEDGDASFVARMADKDFSAKVISLKIGEAPSADDFKNLWQLYWRLRTLRPHVIHGHGAKGGVYARFLARLLGAKSVYTAHGGSLHRVFKPLKRLLYDGIEKALVPLTDALIFESQYSLDTYSRSIKTPAEKGHLVANGIRLPELRPSRRSPVPVLGAFGMLRPIKGHDLLIDAVALLKKKGFELEARIYGSGPGRDDLQKQIATRGLERQVFLMGDTPDPESAMAGCDLIVQPSRFESFGYAAVEAMALGRPVIASAVGGLREIITDQRDGILVKELTADAFAEKIELLLRDPELARRLAAEARNTAVDKFDQLKMVQGVFDVYRRLLARTARTLNAASTNMKK